MDRKTIIGLLLIGGILVTWIVFSMPSKEELEAKRLQRQHEKDSIENLAKEQRIADSLRVVALSQQRTDSIKNTLRTDSTQAGVPDSVRQFRADSIRQADTRNLYGAFASHADGKETFTVIENDLYRITLSNKGARIYSVKMKGYKSFDDYINEREDTLDLLKGQESSYFLTLSTNGGKVVNTDALYFNVVDEPFSVSGEDKKTIRLRAYADEDETKFIEYSYTLTGNNYMLDFDIRFQGMEKVMDVNQDIMDFTWYQAAPHQERDLKGERSRSSIYYRTAGGDVKSIGSGKNGSKDNIKGVKWLSFKQQFFSTTLIADNGFQVEGIKAAYLSPETDSTTSVNYAASLFVPYTYSADETFGMQFYLGPNHYNTLKKYDLGLESQINLGPFFLIRWVNFGVIWVFNIFQSMNLSYGLIILLLTIIIKIITIPVTYRTFVSSAKMRILRPEIEEINEKFPDPGDALKKQQAVMQLYKKAGVSPLSGCIPALLQAPILFAMFSFFPAAVELRQQKFLWAVDLSSYDSVLSLPFHIPFYGDHVSLFTLLMTITTLIYTTLSNTQTAAGGPAARQMKIMMILMPIIFLGVLNSYSAALSYYYFLSNLISIGLTFVIRGFFIDEKKLHAQIEENKKKPVKKSKWAARMEELQKTREQQLKKKKK